jgi:hypothetical protein
MCLNYYSQRVYEHLLVRAGRTRPDTGCQAHEPGLTSSSFRATKRHYGADQFPIPCLLIITLTEICDSPPDD